MVRRTTSFRLSEDIINLLKTIKMYTNKPTHEILEEAILQYVNNNYKELISKDTNTIVKEALEKDITSFIQKEKERTEKWKKLLIKFIRYYIMKAYFLKDVVSNPSDMTISLIYIRGETFAYYEKMLKQKVVDSLTEIDDYEIIKRASEFVEYVDYLSIAYQKEYPILRSEIGHIIVEHMFGKDYEKVIEIYDESRWDPYYKELVNKLEEMLKYLIDEFIKYLKESEKLIKENKFPEIDPMEYILNKINEYIENNQFKKEIVITDENQKDKEKSINLTDRIRGIFTEISDEE